MKHLISALILLSYQNLKAQITFEKQHHFSNYEYTDGNYVVQVYDSGYFVAGELDLLGDTGRIFLLRLDKSGDILWNKTFGHFSESHFNSAALTSDSGMIIVGGNSHPQGPNYYNELYLIRTNKDGDTLWTRSDSTINSYGNLIQQTIDGGFIMTASNDSSGNRDIMLIRMDALGNIMWKVTTPSPHVEDATFLIQTSDGGFALSGYQYSAAGDSTQAMILRTNASGSQIWKTYFSNTSHDNADVLVQTSDGNFVAAIDEKIDSTNLDDILMLKIDSSNGNQIGTSTRLGNSQEDENIHHFALCNDGGFLIIGTIEDTVNEYLFILRIDELGDTVWNRRIIYAEGDWSEQTNDNGFIITGYDNGTSPNNFLYVLKLDSAGNFSTSISEIENSNSFILFPNPATTSITILSNMEHINAKVEIYNLLGEKVYTGDFYEQVSLNCELFSNGIYFVKVSDKEKMSVQKLILK